MIWCQLGIDVNSNVMLVIFRPLVSQRLKFELQIVSVLNRFLDSKRIEQICKPNGWRKPDQVDVQCKRDGRSRLTFSNEIDLNIPSVNDIALELQNLKNSFVNNKNETALELQKLENSFVNNKNQTALELQNLENLFVNNKNETDLELQNLKKSLADNNLLGSCTIRGATGDWFQSSDSVVVKGIF